MQKAKVKVIKPLFDAFEGTVYLFSNALDFPQASSEIFALLSSFEIMNWFRKWCMLRLIFPFAIYVFLHGYIVRAYYLVPLEKPVLSVGRTAVVDVGQLVNTLPAGRGPIRYRLYTPERYACIMISHSEF
jgi:hypothetical protein